MNPNLTCATAPDLRRIAGFNFVFLQFVDLTAGFFTFIFSFSAVKVLLKHSIFQDSTKILLFLNVFYTISYQCVYGKEAILVIYKHFFKQDKPCELLVPEVDCSFYTKLLLFCTSGIIYCQTALILERACSTFFRACEGCRSGFFGVFIAIFVLVCSGITGPIIHGNDPLDGAVLACFVLSKASAARSVIFYYFITGITIFNLVAAISLYKYNATLEYRIRFKLYARFHNREMIESSKIIYFLTFTQFIFMIIYASGFSILKSIRHLLTIEQFNEWIHSFYTVPFIAMVFPIFLTYRIKKCNKNRSRVLIGIANAKQTQEDHINQIKSMWT